MTRDEEKLTFLIDKWETIELNLGLSGNVTKGLLERQRGDFGQVISQNGGRGFAEHIGTAWVNGFAPKSQFASSALKHLAEKQGLLASQGVRPEHIVEYWDLSAEAKALIWLEQNAFRFLVFLVNMSTNTWESMEEASRTSGSVVNEVCPSFAAISVLESEGITSDSPLPNELYLALMPDLISTFSEDGIRGLREIKGEFSSMNAFLRSRL